MTESQIKNPPFWTRSLQPPATRAIETVSAFSNQIIPFATTYEAYDFYESLICPTLRDYTRFD